MIDEKKENKTKEREPVIDYITGKPVVKDYKEHRDAVNVFAKKLVEELGYSKEQIQTVPQFTTRANPSGKDKFPVDIAVFENEQKKIEKAPFMLVECKRKNIKDGEKQLIIYLNMTPSAQIGVWFNGQDHLFLKRIQDPKTGRWDYKPIYVLPKNGESINAVGQHIKDNLKEPKDLKQVFKEIRNHLAGETTGITRDESLAQEIINLLFCKIYDELHTDPDKQLKFRADVEEPAEQVKNRITDLFNEVVKEYDDVFDEGDKLKLDADSIAYVVGALQDYAITKAERDAIGDAFEVFIGPALRGSEGQFFTPRNVVKMAIEMLDPNVEEYIIDPACGSGGFLITTLQYVWKKLDEEKEKKGWTEEQLSFAKKDVASKFFYGIDKDSFLAKVTKAYMAIMGDGRGGIFCENSLLSPSEWNPKTKIGLGKFDVVITNPPFGAKIQVKENDTLRQYELGHKWKFNKETGKWERTNELYDKQPPQILFIERCLQLLKPGGRMGIVLPEGILGNVEDTYIREFILSKADILGVVDLPLETFQPSTGTKTCMLFLKKKNEEETKTSNKIFMAIANEVGHNRRGILIKNDDLPLIAEAYKNKKSNNNVFWINQSEITDFYNLIPRRYNPLLNKPLEEIKSIMKTVSLKKLVKERIISIQKGDEIGSENYTNEGIPFIRTNDIVNGIINRNSKQMVDEDIYNEYKEKQDLKPGDILFTKDGKIGVVGMIKEGDKCIISSGILKIRVEDINKLNPFYLFITLNSKIVYSQVMARYVTAATLMHLHVERFLDIEIPFLSSEEQNKIGKQIEDVFNLKSQADNKLDDLKENFLKINKKA